MDINDIRILVTAIGFICFIAIVIWAYSRKSQKGFDEAANLPFTEDEDDASAARKKK